MSIISSDVKLMESTSNLGGAITATEIVDGSLHNLFDKVTSDESIAGDTEYRCAYVKNTHGTITLEETLSYIAAGTVSASTDISIAVGTSIVGGIEQTVADESTAPIGVTWQNLLGAANGVSLGDIPAGSHMAIWFRRVVNAGTLASPLDGITLTTRGSTV